MKVASLYNQWLKWKSRGGGTVISGFGLLLVVVGLLLTVLKHLPPLVVASPETTKLTSLSGNQAFTFTSLMLILSRKNGKIVQKFNAQYAEMQLLVYHSIPLSVPFIFWKFEVSKRLGLKIGGGGTAFPCVLWHFNYCVYVI